jgi:hypothetical protein
MKITTAITATLRWNMSSSNLSSAVLP